MFLELNEPFMPLGMPLFTLSANKNTYLIKPYNFRLFLSIELKKNENLNCEKFGIFFS